MKNNFDPVGNLLTNLAIFAFCLMFLVLLITLTGCGANQTGAADAATTTEDTMSVGGPVSRQDTLPIKDLKEAVRAHTYEYVHGGE